MHGQNKENRLRGNTAYPIVLYEMSQAEGGLSAAMHWQEDAEVLSVTQGCVALTLDGRQQILHAGDAVWINPGQLHGFQAHTPDARCDIFIFPIQHLLFCAEDHDQQRYLRPMAEGMLGFPLRLPAQGPSLQLQHQLIALQKERPVAYELQTKALLIQLICHLAQADALVPLQMARHDDICKQILEYIQQHYAEKMTVKTIAQAMSISPTYFSAFFMKHFFCRFSDYLRSYRIEQACVMLTGTAMPVTEIALATGFNSSSHLIQHFRKAKGVTPLAYRKSV